MRVGARVPNLWAALACVLLLACSDAKPPRVPATSSSSQPAATQLSVTGDGLRDALLASPAPKLPAKALRRLGTNAFRHPSGLGLQATPDGRRLMSVDQSGELRTWDASAGELLGRFDTFVGGVLLPDGERVITDKGVTSIKGDKLADAPQATKGAVSARYVALVDGPQIDLLDATTLERIAQLKFPRTNIDAIELSPDESKLAVVDRGDVFVYSVPALKPIGKPLKIDDQSRKATFVGNRWIAGVVGLERVKMFDLTQQLGPQDWQPPGSIVIITSLVGARDGKHVIATINASDSQVFEIGGTATPLGIDPAVGIDAAELAGGVFAVQSTDSIRKYELATGKEVDAPVGHRETVTGLAFANGALLSGSDDGRVLRWDVATSKPLATARIRRGVDALARSWDGNLVAVAGEGGKVFDATTLAPVDGYSIGTNDVAWDNAQPVEVGMMGALSIRSKSIDDLDCGTVCQLAVTRSGAVALGDDNGEKLVIAKSFADAKTAPRIEVCGYLRALDRTADRVAFAGDSCARLLDSSGKDVIAFERKVKSEYTIDAIRLSAVVFSADGNYLAVGWEDGLVEIRDAATGTVKTSLADGHRDGVTALAFDERGGLLASGSEDGTIVVWNAN
jgi:WD40 repeat protein